MDLSSIAAGQGYGVVYLVGAGPGDPELLTLRACRLLRAADVVLHDDLVSAEVLAMAGAKAEIVNVGKRCGAKRTTQDEINEVMVGYARENRKVIRLKGGDPGIFGRLGEELEALRSANVPFEVVPGITAGTAAAASLSVSLTDRNSSSRVIIVTGHPSKGGESAIRDWSALAREDATLVIYMPGHDFVALRQELLAGGLAPDMPAVLVSHASTANQRQQFTTVDELECLTRMEAPALLMIGRPLAGASQLTAAKISAGASTEIDLILSSP